MTTRLAIRLGVVLGVAWSVVAGCASKTEGTDSNTHWVACTTVADCPNASSFECVSGRCEEVRDSGSPGAGGAAASSGGSAQTGGAAGLGDGGRSSGGSPGMGTGGAIGLDGATSRTCAPMDARMGAPDCANPIGYAFNGFDCVLILCTCEGADCSQIFQTEQACSAHRLACLGASGVSNECGKNSDCLLADTRCCPTCGEPAITDKVAINVASYSDWRDLVCEDPLPACPPCVPPPGPFQAMCIAGRCITQNLTEAKACTQSSDCVVKPVDCCACGTLTTRNEVMAVNTSTTPTCAGPCAPCPGGFELPPDVHATCGAGYCMLQ